MEKIIRPDLLSKQIHRGNGAFSFPNETSPEEFVSKKVCAIALYIPTVHYFTRKIHAHIRERMISCSFFPVRKKSCHGYDNGYGDIPLISLVRNRPKSFRGIFPI